MVTETEWVSVCVCGCVVELGDTHVVGGRQDRRVFRGWRPFGVNVSTAFILLNG